MQIFDFNFLKDRYNTKLEEISGFLSITGIKEYIKHNNKIWLGGGAIRRALINQKLDSDFDFFFSSKEAFELLYNFLVKEEAKILSKNEHNTTFKLNDYVIQLINIRYYSSPEDIINSFDFTICQFVYDGEKIYCGDTSLFDLANKRLMINKITYPIASFRRIIKYTQQGFYICGGGIQQFLLDCAEMRDKVEESEFKYID